MITFVEAEYLRLTAANPDVHDWLVEEGVIVAPPVTRAVVVPIPVIGLTAVQATLMADHKKPVNTITVSFKLYKSQKFDFRSPALVTSIDIVQTGAEYVGSRHGYAVRLDANMDLSLADGVNTMILPPISTSLSSGSGAVQRHNVIGQSRADITGQRREWPTGAARIV